MKHVSQSIKRLTASAVLTAAVMTGGLATPAHALDVNFGDLVFAMFGNGTEYFKVLGAESGITSQQNVEFNVAAALPAVQGANNVRWSLFSNDDQGVMVTASSKPIGDFNATELSSIASGFSINSGLGWFGLAPLTLPAGTEVQVTNTNPEFFSSTFFTDGTMAGGWPISQEGQLGSLLHLISSDGSNHSGIGTALLTANGLLTINPSGTSPVIPLPAAVWLFGTGLITLVGLARRSKVIA
jgi:hypothetical protein